MSTTERNKGTLKYAGIDIENFSEGNFDTHRENGYLVLDGDIYKVTYEVEAEQDVCDFSEIKEEANGTFSFHTLHYNGGGCLEEVLEEALNKLY